MIGLVGEHGYADTTVPMVVSAARVSRSSFYALFADKTDCFIAACDEESSGMLKLMLEAGAEEDWVEAARRGMERYLKWWQRHPAFSRAYFVELPAAGSRAVRQRDRQYARYRKLFAALGERAREEQPELPPLSPLATRLIVAGVPRWWPRRSAPAASAASTPWPTTCCTWSCGCWPTTPPRRSGGAPAPAPPR